MDSPKEAHGSSATPTTPKLISGIDKEALERVIQRRIAERAYSLFEASGRLDRNDLQHWLQAESEVLKHELDVRESGSWLAISAPLPGIAAKDVQIYLEPNRVLVRATKSGQAEEPESRTEKLTHDDVFFVQELKTEIEPTTASASVRDQQLTLMVKKRYPANVAARGASAGR